MKEYCRLFSKVGLVIFILICSVSLSWASELKPMKLRVASVFPPPSVSMASYAAQLWMDGITEKTDGKIKFQVFWGGALGKPAEHLSMVDKGVADLVLTHRWYTPGKLPLGQFEYIFPFGPSDPVIVTKAKRQIFEEFPDFKKELAAYNSLLIFSGAGCSYEILSKEPITSLAGFKGKKMSLIGRYFGRWVNACGAVPVVAPAADRYTMLQTKVVDMDLLALDLFYSYKVEEQAPNLIIVNALTACWYDLLMNTKTFNKLPKDVQDEFIALGKTVEIRMAEEQVPQWTEKILKDFKEKGVKTYVLPQEERISWANSIEDIPAEWAKEVTEQGYPGWEIVERYQKITTDMGYEWPRKWGKKSN